MDREAKLELGVYEVQDDYTVPEGFRAVGRKIEFDPVADVVREVHILEAVPASEVREQLEKAVKIERDRRLESDFEFMGNMYQRDTKSLQRITGAGTLAGLYMGNGGDPMSFKWHATSEDPNPEDFAWIASDDTLVPMNAATVFAFSREAAAVETRLIFKAKALRSMATIPTDFTDDKWWT
jgi:hypothetical protein